MKLIVGLGNPDGKYARTFHNVGFRAIEKFADEIDARFTKRMCDGVVAEGYFAGNKLLLLKPLTYMNLSGIAVRQIMQKFKISINDLYVFVDDIDLPLGKIRYRESGSAGTHNGLKSIVNELGDTNFKRIKIGIGRDEKFADLADFVLSRIPDDKLEIIDGEIEEACELLKKELIKK
ncbi:MAG: aminoacyl-tRNA hydrolase [Clostridiales bacterium]|nr:aminoacyl-tRNA hydrolase [Clostridiales bacterium]